MKNKIKFGIVFVIVTIFICILVIYTNRNKKDFNTYINSTETTEDLVHKEYTEEELEELERIYEENFAPNIADE